MHQSNDTHSTLIRLHCILACVCVLLSSSSFVCFAQAPLETIPNSFTVKYFGRIFIRFSDELCYRSRKELSAFPPENPTDVFSCSSHFWMQYLSSEIFALNYTYPMNNFYRSVSNVWHFSHLKFILYNGSHFSSNYSTIFTLKF